MDLLPQSLKVRFEDLLQKKEVPPSQLGSFTGWLSSYLDFCRKNGFPSGRKQTLQAFLEKLREKHQTWNQRLQAASAIGTYYEILENRSSLTEKPLPFNAESAREPVSRRPFAAVNRGDPWKTECLAFRHEMQLRHYSSRTLRTYQAWVRKFQAFTQVKAPSSLSAEDVKGFLTFLEEERQVSASTQNQAYNALHFFFQYVLGRSFGPADGVVRTRRKKTIPLVLSREEVDAVLGRLTSPSDLVVRLLYGCGLRLSEGLGLRVQCVNMDSGLLVVHDGKGRKDRTVPLPKAVMPVLKEQFAQTRKVYEQDRARGYDGVFLSEAQQRLLPGAAKDFAWQWLFPAKQLTRVRETGRHRRYHLHESHVQRAIKRAVSEAGISKPATAQTFRHSFASHLLEVCYDIRVVQELMGHSDVRTTRIYTHTLKRKPLEEAKSPLDF